MLNFCYAMKTGSVQRAFSCQELMGMDISGQPLNLDSPRNSSKIVSVYVLAEILCGRHGNSRVDICVSSEKQGRGEL